MALERYGLGATLTADDKQFVQATNRARNSLGQFLKTADRTPPTMQRMSRSVMQATRQMQAGFKQIGAGVKQLGAGLRNAALGALPLTAAVGAGVKKAAEFERQMSAVGAITRTDEEGMAALTKEAKRMGIVSVFSATQAGEGMEYLARAGAKPQQIIAALQGTMNAAAADAIDLATASDIVAQVVKGMDLAWGEAAHVADVLALASASANTNITQLGESFKYGVSQAKALGISLEESTMLFSKMADAGLKGSLAGTAFTNMMGKLAKPSDKAKEIMKKFKISLDNADGSLRKISDIVSDVSKGMEGVKNASERAYIASELFGKRGMRAYNALAVAGKKAMDDLEDALIGASVGVGAATEMAEKRLDNFLGKLTLFGASVESISIGIFGPLLKEFTPVVESMTNSLNDVLFSLEGLNEIRKKENMENAKSAQMIARTAANTLENAGAVDKYRRSSLGALQVITRMRIGEEELSSTQVEARKRALMAAIETETKQQAAMIRTRHQMAAGNKTVADMSEKRRALMQQQIDAMTKARTEAAKKQVELAFSGAEGASEAQKALRSQILKEALASNKKLSAAERTRIEQEIAMMSEVEAAKAREADAIRSRIFSIEKMQEIEEKHGSTAVQMALGLQDAIDTLKDAWDSLVNKVKELGKWMEDTFGKDGVRKITKIATIFAIVAAAAVPILLALVTFGFMVSGLATAFAAFKTIAVGALAVVKGGLALLAGAFWPITLAIAAVTLAFLFFRREGESIGDTFIRAWTTVKNAVLDFRDNVWVPFLQGFKEKWDENIGSVIDKWRNMWDQAVQKIETTVAKIKERFNAIFGSWFQGLDSMEIKWDEVGGKVAEGVLWVASVMADAIGLAVDAFVWLMDTIWSVIEGPLMALKAAGDALMANWQEIKNTFLNVWNVIVETFSEVAAEIKAAIGDIVAEFSAGAGTTETDWVNMGTTIGNFISAMLIALIEVVGFVVTGIGKIVSFLIPLFKTPIITISRVFKDVFGGILMMFEGDFLGGLKRIGIAIFNALTMPLRMVMGTIIKLIRAIPGAEKLAGGLGVDLGLLGKWMEGGIQSDEVAAELDKAMAAKPTIKAAMQGAETAKAATEAVQPQVADQQAAAKAGTAEQIALLKDQVAAIGDLKAQAAAKAAEKPEVKAEIQLEDKRTIDINNKMCVDGESVNVASARHKQEIQDRSGFKSTPWQRRSMLEHGAAPVKGVA
jgi:TP901 family phage tail tape measure protein